MSLVRRFLQDESGATAIEYGLIAGLVAVAIIAALTLLASPAAPAAWRSSPGLQELL